MQHIKNMNNIFSFGIRQKLLMILLIVLLTALTLSGWMALDQEKQNTLEEINQRGTDITRFVAKSLSFSVVGYDYHTIQLLLDEITSFDDIGYARVTNQRGNVMGEAGELDQTRHSSLVMFQQVIKLDENIVGYLELGLSTTRTIATLEQKKNTILKREIFIVLLIALGEFIALSFFIIRPVRLMSETMVAGIDTNGRIIEKIPVVSRDEFGQLAESFNHLSERLNSANQQLQSKIELADQQLLETNQQLRKQSEELKIINRDFKKLSITDSLTGLYNRRHFEELLKTEFETARRHAEVNSLIIFDIDLFKNINDTYGHPCGDSILREISSLLSKRMRKTDYLCRLGGEEFVVLCKRADKQSALEIAEEMRRLVEKTTFNCGQVKVRVTISLGVATISPSDSLGDPEIVYKQADKAVYYCKQRGRNMCAHYDNINEELIAGEINA